MKIFIFVLFSFFLISANAKSICGTIKSTTGDVSATPRLPKKKVGAKIYSNSKITTGPEGSVVIALPGINILEVHGGSKVQITRCSFNKKSLSTVVEMKLEKGEMSAKALTKSKRASVKMVVRTPNSHLTTAQAEFDLVYDDITRKSEVSVYTGSVSFSLQTKKEKLGTMEVSEAETAYVYPGSEPAKRK